MTPYDDNSFNDTADTAQILREAEQLAAEIAAGSEALEIELEEPITEIQAMTAEVEANYNNQEIELNDINEAFLSSNERDVAAAAVKANIVMSEEQ